MQSAGLDLLDQERNLGNGIFNQFLLLRLLAWECHPKNCSESLKEGLRIVWLGRVLRGRLLGRSPEMISA